MGLGRIGWDIRTGLEMNSLVSITHEMEFFCLWERKHSSTAFKLPLRKK